MLGRLDILISAFVNVALRSKDFGNLTPVPVKTLSSIFHFYMAQQSAQRYSVSQMFHQKQAQK